MHDSGLTHNDRLVSRPIGSNCQLRQFEVLLVSTKRRLATKLIGLAETTIFPIEVRQDWSDGSVSEGNPLSALLHAPESQMIGPGAHFTFAARA